jgi:hypothetical protein
VDQDILDFIKAAVGSVWALELLLFMRAHAGRAWTARELAAELRSNERLSGEAMGALESAGLLAPRPGGLAYAPASPGLDRMVGKVAAAYRERPVRVVNAIAARSARPYSK